MILNKLNVWQTLKHNDYQLNCNNFFHNQCDFIAVKKSKIQSTQIKYAIVYFAHNPIRN